MRQRAFLSMMPCACLGGGDRRLAPAEALRACPLPSSGDCLPARFVPSRRAGAAFPFRATVSSNPEACCFHLLLPFPRPACAPIQLAVAMPLLWRHRSTLLAADRARRPLLHRGLRAPQLHASPLPLRAAASVLLLLLPAMQLASPLKPKWLSMPLPLRSLLAVTSRARAAALDSTAPAAAIS